MFGEMVRAHRRRLGVTQEELAERTGLSTRGIGNLEAGRIAKPRPGTVRLLADAFGLAGAERDSFCLAAPGEAAGTPLVQRPAQLPPDLSTFVGRHEQLTCLDALVNDDGDHPAAVVISAIAGPPGVGKTALAIRWAHRMASRFPDGQLYVDLRGFDPSGNAVAPAEAVSCLLDALGVPPERIPADLDARVGLYRSMLPGNRILLVLDNARDADQVRPLLPGSPAAFVVVTSRSRLTSLVAAADVHPITLDVLSRAEARNLLGRRIGADRVGLEPDAVETIITACARLPLALSLVAAYAKQTGFPLAAAAAELDPTDQRLDVLDAGDAAGHVRAVFSWSYANLSAAGARLFRLLGLHPGRDVTAAAAASLAGEPLADTRRLLVELANGGLVTEHAPGRYTFHDLLRAYAAEQARAIDPDDDRRGAVYRVLDHYLHTAYAAERLLFPTRNPITLGAPQPGVITEEPGDYDRALAWFTAEHTTLLAAVDTAADAGLDRHTWQLAWAMSTFLHRRGHWHDRAATQRAAVAAARRLCEPAQEASANRYLADAYTSLCRFDDARVHLEQALGLYRRTGDRQGQAITHYTFAHLCGTQGRHAEALHHAHQAQDLHAALGNRLMHAAALNEVGWRYSHLGDHQQALIHCQQALAAFQELGERAGQAAAWDSLGYAYHHLGRHADAAGCYQHAVILHREVGDHFEEAQTLDHLGETHRAAGHPVNAREVWRRAIEILTDLDHPDTHDLRGRLQQLAHADLPEL